MKKLHLFLIKSYLGPLIMTFFISLFVLLMQFLWKYIDDIVGKGLEWNVITELLLYTSATLVPMALPLAILLASIMTFGNLGENYELVALKSAGLSLQRIMMPLIIITFIISVLAFFFSNNMMHIANLKFNSLLYDVRNQRPQLSIKEGIFNNDIAGYSMKIGRKDNKKNIMYDILIYDHKSGSGNERVTVAKSGTMILTKDKQYLILTLSDGYAYEEQDPRKRKSYEKNYPHQREKFEEQTVNIELSGFKFTRTSENLFNNNYQMFSVKQLTFAIDSLNKALLKTKDALAANLLLSGISRREQGMQLPPEEIGNTTVIQKVQLTSEIDCVKTTGKIKQEPAIEYNTSNINIDSLYNLLETKKRIEMLDYAANQIRGAKTTISNSKEEFNLRQKNIRRHEIELHRKFTLSFACMVLFFIGAPLGAIIRKGGLGMPMIISVFFFIIYYVISISGEKFVREEMLTASQGMWLSSAILLPLGIFLTYKASKESTLMSNDTYKLFFKKLFRRNKNSTSMF